MRGDPWGEPDRGRWDDLMATLDAFLANEILPTVSQQALERTRAWRPDLLDGR